MVLSSLHKIANSPFFIYAFLSSDLTHYFALLAPTISPVSAQAADEVISQLVTV